MRVLVALENRFYKSKSGNIYSQTVCDYNFWCRYLQVFDEVLIFARLEEISENELNKLPANGQGVNFIPLPTYTGPWEYFQHLTELKNIAKYALTKSDAYILRVPGSVASVLWSCIVKNGLTYGVEVVGDPWDSLGKGTIKNILRPIARHVLSKKQKKQCLKAKAAAYVTEKYLQQRYPTSGWSTHYSNVELPSNSIIDKKKLTERIYQLNRKAKNRQRFKICHVGTMSALYKAQDNLIEAIAVCREKGFNVELTLIGDGQYQSFFVKKAIEAGVQKFVNFTGRIASSREIIEQLDNADIFILPSLAEGMPRSLIEAMARGLPCIASCVGGIAELLPKEDLIRPKNIKDLVDKIIEIINSPDRLERMVLHNVAKAGEFCTEKLNERRVEFYKKVIEISNNKVLIK